MNVEELNRILTLESAAPYKEEAKVLYGLMAEFNDHQLLLAAARSTYAEGYRNVDAYSPFPIEELAESLGHHFTLIPLFTLLGGISGGLGGYFMEWFSMGRLYALNVGGRPLNSWPQFIPITFELTILIAALSAFTSMLVLNRLPQPYHPVFNVPEFRRASIDRFFICIEAKDPSFAPLATRRFLESLKPLLIREVVE